MPEVLPVMMKTWRGLIGGEKGGWRGGVGDVLCRFGLAGSSR